VTSVFDDEPSSGYLPIGTLGFAWGVFLSAGTAVDLASLADLAGAFDVGDTELTSDFEVSPDMPAEEALEESPEPHGFSPKSCALS
jgi:hypothetical protein